MTSVAVSRADTVSLNGVTGRITRQIKTPGHLSGQFKAVCRVWLSVNASTVIQCDLGRNHLNPQIAKHGKGSDW